MSSQTTQPAPKRGTGLHHGDLKNALEQAALDLIAEKGPRGFTLAEVTRRAGVTPAAPYKHFPDRDALLASLAERGYREQRVRFATAIEQEDDPVDQIAAFAAAYVEFAITERALFEVTFRAGLDKALYPPLGDAGEQVLSVLRESARQLRDSDESAIELVYAVAASAHGFASFLLEGVFPAGADSVESVSARARASARLLTGSA